MLAWALVLALCSVVSAATLDGVVAFDGRLGTLRVTARSRDGRVEGRFRCRGPGCPAAAGEIMVRCGMTPTAEMIGASVRCGWSPDACDGSTKGALLDCGGIVYGAIELRPRPPLSLAARAEIGRR